jgi:hypothetical protein
LRDRMAISKPIIHEFPYRAGRLTTGFLLALACAGAVLCACFALYSQEGVRHALRGIELTRTQFRVLTGIVAILSPVGIVPLALLFLDTFRHPRRVAFTADSVILPKPSRLGLSREEIELPFDEIRFAEIEPFMGRTKVLMMVNRAGVIYVPSNMFAARGDFEAVARGLGVALVDPGGSVLIACCWRKPG